MIKCLVYTLLLLFAVAGSCLGDKWTPPAKSSQPAQLPMLTRQFSVDGEVKEWTGAAVVPVRSTSDFTHLSHLHEWKGPSDAGMEAYCAWNSEGLCLAFVVADDDICVSNDDSRLWEKDCVEIFLDGRSSDKLMKPPFTPGAYQVLVRPPTLDKPSMVVVNTRDGKIDAVKVAGKVTSRGYSIEVLIPWSAFPGFHPASGALIGLQFSLNEYDDRDGDLKHPVVLSYLGAKDLWCSPQNFVGWRLVDRINTGPDADLGPLVNLEVPAVFPLLSSMPVSVRIGETLSNQSGSVRVSLEGANKLTVVERSNPLSQSPDPWQQDKEVKLDLPVSAADDGYVKIRASVIDKNGRQLGWVSKPVLFLGHTLPDALSFIEKADLKNLVRKEPFKTVQYLAVGSRVEKLKRSVELRRMSPAVSAAREIKARIELLENGKCSSNRSAMLDLLNLTADPESQVVVEYPEDLKASVAIYWGSIPMVWAEVTQFSTHEQAQSIFDERLSKPHDKSRFTAISRNRLISICGPSTEAAKRFADLIAAGTPVRLADADAIRLELVKALSANMASSPRILRGRLFCGDLHMHTSHSDGQATPVGLLLEAMYCYMDFAAITDHNTLEGVTLAAKLFADSGLNFPITAGEEITTEWSHFNAYPLKEVIQWEMPAEEIIKSAHAQDAVIQWNHPTAVPSEWTSAHLSNAAAGTGLDAWEHIPTDYKAWKLAGTLPVLTATTDTHDGTFSYAERTVIMAPNAEGKDIAGAVRRNRTLAISGHDPLFFYGSDEMIASVVAALNEGKALKAFKAERLSTALMKADVVGMLKASPALP